MENDNIVMTDLSRFGYKELEEGSKLLMAYANDQYETQEDKNAMYKGLQLCFNSYSGVVFLTDDDYQVLLLNDNDKLESWLNCWNCGKEKFRSDCKKDGWKSDFTCEDCEE